MTLSSRIGLFASALLCACTIRVDQRGGDGSADAECLDLFETCVELAGESPGCTEVYQFCQGSVVETGTGGSVPDGGCEQDYVDCLQGGGSPEECQPLLDQCSPPDPTGVGTTGLCVFGDPDCEPQGSTGGDSDATCEPDDPDCNPSEQCEAQFQNCMRVFGDESVCLEMQASCEAGDCESAMNICVNSFGEQELCAEITNCENLPPPRSQCDELRSNCEASGLQIGQCSFEHPDAPDCFPEVGECIWFQQECVQQFAYEICYDGIDACISGYFPGYLDCDDFLAEACSIADLTDMGCTQATAACNNGFFDVEFCAKTRLYEDAYQWLSETAECNGWNM